MSNLKLTSFGWLDEKSGIEYATEEEALESESTEESNDDKKED